MINYKNLIITEVEKISINIEFFFSMVRLKVNQIELEFWLNKNIKWENIVLYLSLSVYESWLVGIQTGGTLN